MSSANMCVYAPSVEDSLAILPGQACPDPTNDAKACAAGSFCYLGECHSLCDPAQTGNQCGQGFSCIHPYLSNETVSTWGLCGELCHPGKAPFPYSGCLNNKICLFGGSQNEGFCAFPTDALLGQNATCSTEQGGALLPANQRCKDGYICASGKCAKICSRTANYSCKNNQTCSGYPIHDWGVCWQPILEGHQQTGESCLISGGMPEYTCTDTTICHLPAGGNSVCIEPCASNADCEEGEICNENTGLCALDTVTAGCTSDSDCGEGQICSEGECMMSEGPTPECNTDDDCGEGQICQGGECIDEGGSCMDDSDCSTGQVCQDGDCVTGTSSGCTSNADCSTGQICINSGGQGGGQCITGSYTGCASSSECQPGFECAGGYCIDLGGFAM